MPKAKKTLNQQIRQRSLDAQRKVSDAQRKQVSSSKKAKDKRREHKRTATVDANGLTPSMRIALARRSKEVQENPVTQALVQRANARVRVAKLRRDHKMDEVKPAPGFEFGRVIKTEAPVKTVAQRIAEERAGREMPVDETVAPAKYVPPSQRKKGKKP